MVNLLSKLSDEEKNNPLEIKIGERFDIYISALNINKNIEKDKFVLLNGIKGMFKIEDVHRFVNSSEYKIQVIRENYPKDYSGSIERIDSYSTKDLNDSSQILA